MQKESYLTAQDALDLGLIDEIIDPVEGLDIQNLINEGVEMADNKKSVTPEPTNVTEKEFTKVVNRLDKAEKTLEKYQNQLEESSKQVTALQQENAKLQNSLKKSGLEKFVDKLSNDGKLYPGENVDRIIKNLENADKISPEDCAAYMKELEERKPIDLLKQNVANKEYEDDATPASDLEKEIAKIVNEKNVPYHEAYRIAVQKGVK